MPRPRRARRAAVALSRRRRGDAAMPLPEIQIFGGGAHAGAARRHPGFHGRLPERGVASPRRSTGPPRSIARPAQLMAERGLAPGRRRRRRLLARLRSPTRQALDDAGAARSSAPASRRATRSRSRSTSPPPSSAATGATGSALRAARARHRRHDRACCSAGSTRYPIVSIEDPLGRGRRRRASPLHRGGRRPACRSSATISSSPNAGRVREAARAGACNAVLLKPNQAGTLTETKAALDAAQRRGFGDDRLGPLRRDRGRDDRPPRGRLGRRPAQGRLVRALRAHGEMERGAAHRGGARPRGPLGAALRSAPLREAAQGAAPSPSDERPFS